MPRQRGLRKKLHIIRQKNIFEFWNEQKIPTEILESACMAQRSYPIQLYWSEKHEQTSTNS